MKINLDHIIQQCKLQSPQAQKELYEHYKSVLFGICKRYLVNDQDAEDVFVEAFYKIFSKIDDFHGDGSFEGWMKRIMINESLMFLRKNKKLRYEVDIEGLQIADHEDIEADLAEESIISAIEELPQGYRTVLNMYLVEGYKHREIAEILGISINTSKSQLILAKKKMQEKILAAMSVRRSI